MSLITDPYLFCSGSDTTADEEKGGELLELQSFYKYLSEHADLPEEWSSPSEPGDIELSRIGDDCWHTDAKAIMIGAPELNHAHHIWFHPLTQPCTIGVAMELAWLTTDSEVTEPTPTLEDQTGHYLLWLMCSKTQIRIRWPASHSTNGSALTFQHPLTFHDATSALLSTSALAKQIARIFYKFFEKYAVEDQLLEPNEVFRGPGGIDFGRLQLVRLWLYRNGALWDVEMAVVQKYEDIIASMEPLWQVAGPIPLALTEFHP